MSKQFVFTQSALKDLEKSATCPVRWKLQWLDRLFGSPTSEAANYGNYFEYLCIGGSAHGSSVTELPLTSYGTKTATQKRIEAQVDVYNKLILEEGYDVIGTQIKLSGAIEGSPTEGTLDILTNYHGEVCIVDLKMTGDLDNTRTEYGWGNPINRLDFLQQVLYQELYFQTYGVRPLMHLLVFEHGTKCRHKIIKLDITDSDILEMKERFKAGKEVVELYNSNGWVYDPSENECKKCKADNCQYRFSK